MFITYYTQLLSISQYCYLIKQKRRPENPHSFTIHDSFQKTTLTSQKIAIFSSSMNFFFSFLSSFIILFSLLFLCSIPTSFSKETIERQRRKKMKTKVGFSFIIVYVTLCVMFFLTYTTVNRGIPPPHHGYDPYSYFSSLFQQKRERKYNCSIWICF